MANALGTVSPGQPNTLQTVVPLIDPRHVREERLRYRRAAIPELSRANCFYCPADHWPARGWLLVGRGYYNQLNPYATNLCLQISDGTNTLTFRNLTIVQARCVTRGVASDPNAVYLVEVTDRRGVLLSPWFALGTTSQYNVLSPAYPGQYYDGSLNAGAAWTWDGMVGNLWTQMNSQLGAYPGLPITPAGTPTNWIFPGTSCWLAMSEILDHIGCQVKADLTLTSGQYTIVQEGAIDSPFTLMTAKYQGLLEEDLEWIDTGSGRTPGQVVVYFHRINQYYGTEETVRKDSLQWSTTNFWSVTVPSPAPFTTAAGTHFLWDDFAVRFDVDGNPLAADVATATAIATERVSQYFARIYRSTLGFMTRVYGGVLPFTTDSEVDGVAWKMDFESGRKGWLTEVVRGPQPPWPEIYPSEEFP